jgi:hypothetical protein
VDPVQPLQYYPTDTDRPKCHSCLWFRMAEDSNGQGGHCMFNPPTVMLMSMPNIATGGNTTVPFGARPTTAVDDYCARYDSLKLYEAFKLYEGLKERGK